MGTLFSTVFWDAPGKRLSKALGRLVWVTAVPWQRWRVLARTGLCAAACSLLSSGTSSRSITSFLPSRFSSGASAAVSSPSSCFVAPAILTTQLTIYPDGAALVSCAWHVFSIYKFCVRAEATNPNYLCEVSGACLLWPHLASPDPSPSPAPFRPHLGVLSSLSLLFPSRRSHHQTSPWPSCSKELPLFS